MPLIDTNRQTGGPSYKREELINVEAKYKLIDDVLGGSDSVKMGKYLPVPNAEDDSVENLARYDAYKTRAVFYAVTRVTLQGFIGELFAKDPVINIPGSMKDIIEDATGEGVGIVQMAKAVANVVLSKGRAGLRTDYPTTTGAVTQEDIAAGVRPIIRNYHPLAILNWRYKKVGALNKLCLVVLEEEYDISDDGFMIKKGKQWRVMRLDANNEYNVCIYRDTGGLTMFNEAGQPIPGPIYATDAKGERFQEIPFTFIGSDTNNADVDYPPLFDMADMNLHHYFNSADYEENVYITGQATPVIKGLTQDWADRYFKNGVALGSRAAVLLPVGADATLLQADERNSALAAMEHKEKQMIALGAKIVEDQQVQKTATETSLESASEKSTLSTVSDNISVAFEWALGWAAMFAGVPDGEIVFRVNKEFSLAFSSPESRKEVIESWQAEAISFTEMRTALRKGGTATLDDKIARKEIQTDRMTSDAPLLADNTDAQGNPLPDPNAPPKPAPDPLPGNPIQTGE